MTITDWLIIARSGATVDGRKISAKTLKLMAEVYDPATYTAVVNYNHSSYSILGMVRELRAVEKDGYTELQARIQPNKYYYMYNSESMGLFFSIEYIPNFAKTGKPYLYGLAAVDHPASLGTSELKFSVLGIEEQVEFADGVEWPKGVEKKKLNLKEFMLGVLSEFYNKKEDDEMTVDEVKLAFSDVVKPISDKLASLEEQMAKFAVADVKVEETKTEEVEVEETKTEEQAPSDGDAKGEFASLQEKFATIDATVAELSKTIATLGAKLDAALAGGKPKSQNNFGDSDEKGCDKKAIM